QKGLPQVQYAFLELPKYEAGDAPETVVDRWAYFFREAKNLNVVPPPLAEAPFRDALEIARTTTFSAEEWEVYERAKMAEQDARGALTVARQEGRQQGELEGRQKGRLEGKREGLLRLLDRRGLSLTDEGRALIAACEDATTLDRWFDQALGAKTLGDVFA
ncbi:MAG: PD-(D/E)XK nuclease family transposase, partial [Myxococcales bacterium]|nr:PD-(D/E)XK nuclease family transposase [Myxococcales bacterium]